MPPYSRSGCGSHARSSITQAHEPRLDHMRRKDVLPRLNNDGPLCVLSLLCCLKLCRFCSMVIGADISAWWRVRKTTCHHPQSLRTSIRAGRVVGTEVVQLRGGGTRGRGQTRPEEKGSAMPPHTVITTMLGGLLGTVAQIMESREMLGVMPLPGSLPPQGPCLDTSACRWRPAPRCAGARASVTTAC
jgi:hypothetical protein